MAHCLAVWAMVERKPWRWEHEAAGHTAAAAREQEDTNAGVQLASSIFPSYSLRDASLLDAVALHQVDLLIPSGCVPIYSPSDLSPRHLRFQSRGKWGLPLSAPKHSSLPLYSQAV